MNNNTADSDPSPEVNQSHGMTRRLGLLQATALNMTNMIGVGPFITISLMISSMGGPQCMLGWALGTLLALCDGLVWSELAAAMPGAGGTFLYLREAFRKTALGRILPFLFVWQFIFSGPLELATGYIGFAQYLGYFWRSMGFWQTRLVAAAVGVAAVFLLYRRITAIGKLTLVFWFGILAATAWVIVSGFANFDAKLAFDFPPDAFSFSRGFALGLGGAMLIAIYDLLGYFDICFVGGEVRNPERVIPRAVILSVVAVGLIYSLMTLAIIAVVPWREAMKSQFLVAEFMQRIYGPWAGRLVALMILWAAFASIFALLLGYSRIPYAAALQGFFFKPFAKLHPTGNFPSTSLLVVGALAILASMLELHWVLSALLTARIVVQFIGQIFALHYLRKHRPEIRRPFKMWLYPLPSLIALVGWTYIFVTSGWTFILYGTLTLAGGVVAYAFWRKRSGGPEEITEGA